MNVVVGEVGVPHAVLLRGGIVTEGLRTIEHRRGRFDHLTDGPGKLCEALGVTDNEGGTSVVDGSVRLLPGTLAARHTVLATPRIGISKATEEPWRFVAAR
jgi:DNA-3-methyladenine glycosylase